jgi:ATP-binding cassette subfamily B protein
VPLDSIDLAAWRRKVGYVPQDSFLFNASVRENIVLWEPDANPADVERAARMAELHDFIEGLPQGYETRVGDRGVALSGGQCQRLAIARALFRHPRVFVFDEATSALDNATERAVYDAIRTLRQDAIVIVVAHRLSTIREADQIVVMDGGRVVESGTHTDLLGRGGLYARLFQVDSVVSDSVPM